MILLSLYLLLTIVSYYFTWSADQAMVTERDAARELALKTGEAVSVHNGGGSLGATLGRFFAGRLFGVFALAIPVLLGAFALMIARFRTRQMEKGALIAAIVMILGSVTLGILFGRNWGIFGSGLGGECGICFADWLKGYIGVAGVLLLLLLCWVLFAVWLNRSTIKVVNKVGDTVARKTVAIFTPKAKQNVDETSDNVAQTTDDARQRDDNEESAANNEHTADNNAQGNEPTEPDEFDITDSADPTDVGESDRSAITAGDAQSDESNAEGRSVAVAAAVATDGKVSVVDSDDDIPIEITLSSEPQIEIDSADNADAEEQDDAVVIDGNDPNADDAYSGFRRRQTDQQGGQFEFIDEQGGMEGLPKASIGAGGIIASAGGDGEKVIRERHDDAQVDENDVEDDLYDPTKELGDYKKPPLQLLDSRDEELSYSTEEIVECKRNITNTLHDFDIGIKSITARVGPTVTLYELEPAQGVRISRIRNLEDDISLSLKALSIRIIAPMPGRGTIGIEIPNRDRKTVSFCSLVKSLKFQQSTYELPIVLGKTIQNETYMVDLVKLPHLLVAGATGQGKSVGLNVIINSLLYKKHPAELKFVMVDPKKVELSLYAKLEKHFLAKMESEDDAILTDTQKVVYTLNSLCHEMEARYTLLQKAEVKKLSEYNEKFLQRKLSPRKGHRYMPYIVVVVDEFADMIMTAGKEIETPITRLAQLARAVGIHLIIATQRPDVKVITGLIKANFPARIAFRVTTMIDSRTILDQPGANRLIGQGDMLMMLNGDLTRLQCGFIDTPEIERVTRHISSQIGYNTAYLLPDYVPEDGKEYSKDDMGQLDSMFEEIARFVVEHKQGSTSYIQRRFSIGYTRAGRIMDQLEHAGIVGPVNGSKPRDVLVFDLGELNKILNDLLV